MKLKTIASLLVCGMLAQASQAAWAQQVLETGAKQPMPQEWIDKDTGHRVLRLSGATGPISNWYFHNNPFVPQKGSEGDRMVYSNEIDGVRQLFAYN